MADFIGVYGASGCGRGLMPLVRGVSADRRIFIDDGLQGTTTVNGYVAMGWNEFVELGGKKMVCLGVADPRVRAALAKRVEEEGIELAGVCDETVVMFDDVTIGAGACLSPHVTLTSNITVGRAFHGNLYSYVEHDCVIGDFVTFAPRVSCNGNVHIGDYAYIGAGAVIRQGTPQNPLKIGEGAIVGMGAVVTKDVPAGATVVGNPARTMDRDA